MRIGSVLLACGCVLFWSALGQADDATTAEGQGSLVLAPAAQLPGDLLGRPVLKLEVVTAGGRWQTAEKLQKNTLGQPLTAAYARAILRELLESGRYAQVSARALPLPNGALLRVTVLPRRIVTEVRVTGGSLDNALVLEAVGVAPGDDITVETLPKVETRIRELYRKRGYPAAIVTSEAVDTDEPLQVVLLATVHPGDPLIIGEREFEVHPRMTGELSPLLTDYEVGAGDRADGEQLDRADLALAGRLRVSGYHEAAVEHRTEWADTGFRLVVVVWSGPKIQMRFSGNESFDAEELGRELELPEDAERAPAALAERVRDFYVKRGFLDATVDFERRDAADATVVEFWFHIREQERVAVRRRHFPCLTGSRTASDVAAEIDSFLSEALPGPGLIGPVDPNQLDRSVAPGRTGRDVPPFALDPWTTYHPGVYEKALEHLQALYRSEGYLSARVGPVDLLRRACDPASPVGHCIPLGPRPLPRAQCTHDENAPEADAAAAAAASRACVPDPKRGLTCEPQIELSIPIVLGPRAELWDIGFEGNRALVESDLQKASGLTLGGPVSQLALEEARRRIVERYAEDGYAFAGVELDLELSPDRTRAKAKFTISEREPVTVREVVVHGAHFTDPGLITSRAALTRGQLYRRSLVRATEERLATLGVFTSVTVDLEDPEVPARQKVVVIRVQERLPQYLDVRPGFSTGEGLRIAFEYGHRNLGGKAIQLVLRVQLGYLPPPLILDTSVRNDFEKVLARESLLFLLERRNSATLEFPEVGLGPLFRLGVEGLDVRDISRDFALEKHAAIVTLNYRPERSFNVSLATGVEFNEADIFLNGDDLTSLQDYLSQNPGNRALQNLLNIPDGLTLAIFQRLGVTWDRRDNAVAATRGTLVSVGLEHVNAFPVAGARSGAAMERTSSYKGNFLQYTGRVAGYLRLSERGLALATSFRWGFNQQLVKGSTTYPDRLFFLGGVDSLRGFALWSLVPQDLDRTLRQQQANGTRLTENEIPLNGGDLMINPRAELRIPLVGIWQTALFLDTGNLWAQSSQIWQQFQLRYSAGVGVRVNTPVGPLALDYGIKLDRRFYESFGAFHFSIGLF
jgi:outer membrane protein insertion porin family